MVPGGVVKPSVYAFFRANWLWMQQQVAARPHDAYWTQVGLLMAQLEGITQVRDGSIEGWNEYDWLSDRASSHRNSLTGLPGCDQTSTPARAHAIAG